MGLVRSSLPEGQRGPFSRYLLFVCDHSCTLRIVRLGRRLGIKCVICIRHGSDFPQAHTEDRERGPCFYRVAPHLKTKEHARLLHQSTKASIQINYLKE